MGNEMIDAIVIQADGVSTVRGGGLPMRGCRVTVLGMMPPSREKSITPAISRA